MLADRVARGSLATVERMIARRINAPPTSTVRRLFDAVAVIAGAAGRVSHEAQSAMELEALAAPRADVTYATRLDDTGDVLVVRTTDVVRGVVDDLLRETPAAVIAARFRATLADVIVSVCGRIRERTGVGAVALSGGVFQNAWLLEAALDALETAGFEVYSHRDVPANDGGASGIISLCGCTGALRRTSTWGLGLGGAGAIVCGTAAVPPCRPATEGTSMIRASRPAGANGLE